LEIIVSKEKKTAIQPKREENFPEWYQQVIKQADMAENSPIRGCMVIKPWGYTLWENIRNVLDKKFKKTGHVNAYFPLFIPLHLMEKEAEHVEGFAKECAVVTHHRLQSDQKHGLKPAGKLEEPLVIRPTSETIIGEMFAKWVQSYRDLPLLINQWANIVRWEMRTRLFLRTTEFLWQEGHTAHQTEKEAWEETLTILDIYKDFAEEYMAIPVLTGEKTENERFPGAIKTLCIEAMMQDRKALQSGTSHFLGQNFAKASNIQFQDQNGDLSYVWTTSWGVSTRLIGGIIMVHGDDNGMCLPPRLAPTQVVILPIIKNDSEKEYVFDYCNKIAVALQEKQYYDKQIEVSLDTREMNAGEKSWEWIKKGVPVILEIGPRDIQNDSVFVYRRDKTRPERYSQKRDIFIDEIIDVLDTIQNALFNRAQAFRNEHTREIDDYTSFQQFFTPHKKSDLEIFGGFALSHWCGSTECENKINEDLSVSIRCIPLSKEKSDKGKCILCGKQSMGRVVFARAY